MRPKTWILGLAITGILVTGMVSVGSADTWNKKTVVTFSESVELPGQVVVPAGKYVFKLADSQANRHIVQVMSEAEDKVHATILAIPTERQEPADKTVLTFYETPKDQPMFIHKWYYPGNTIGQEFAYPKDRASYIAKTANTKVLVAPGEESGEISAYMTPDNQEEAIARSADKAANETGKAADKAEDALDTAADKTENAIGKAADATESAVGKAADAVEKAADATVDAGQKAADKVEQSADAVVDDRADADANARVDADQAAAAPAQAEPAQADPDQDQAPAAAPAQADPATRRTASDADQSALPQTASFMPLIGLSGVALLGAASLLRRRARR